MKKLIFAVLAVMVMAVPMANAQKINKSAALAKLEKADASIADAKKNTKAATWVAHGKAYFEAATIATKNLYENMPITDLKLTLGEPTATNADVVLNNVAYTELVYPWLKIYVTPQNLVATWIVTEKVRDDVDMAAIALESFNKAYELDNNIGKKIEEDMQKLVDYYSMCGNTAMSVQDYVNAAYNFESAYNVQLSPAFGGEVNHMFPFYAGYYYAVDGQNNPASYAKGAEALSTALAAGFTDEKGDIYYYLYMCYYAQTDSPVRAANLERAKQVLMEGLAKFPSNDLIVEGLVNVYTSDSTVGNPADLIDMVDKALERDPQNSGLWYGRGRIFYSLKNFDESIASFKKVVEIDPSDAYTWYYIGYFYVNKADAMNEEFNQRNITSAAEWNAEQEKILAVYSEALPYIEKAHEMSPETFDFVETLKALTFRLRDEEGVMPKYEKYNKIYEELKAKQ